MHAELGSKLSWQNTGPYRVLASQKHGREYRLQHLATGDICIHSATDLHPYLVTQGFDDLTVEQKKELIPQAKPVDPGSRVSSIQDVKPGQYMWLLPAALRSQGSRPRASRTPGSLACPARAKTLCTSAQLATRRRCESSRIGDRGADFSAEVPSLVNHESALPLYTGQ